MSQPDDSRLRSRQTSTREQAAAWPRRGGNCNAFVGAWARSSPTRQSLSEGGPYENRLFPFTLVLLFIYAPVAFPQQETSNDAFHDPTGRVFELVLPSEHLFGDWGGLRPKLEEAGITPRLILVTNLAGNPSGGRSQGVTAPSSVELSLFFDLDKIFGLNGGSIFASFSERWGHRRAFRRVGYSTPGRGMPLD